MCGKKVPLMSMGGCAECRACADLGARTPIDASEIFCLFLWLSHLLIKPQKGSSSGFKFLHVLQSNMNTSWAEQGHTRDLL